MTGSLILIRGLPGSGKSTLAARIEELLGVDTVVLLDPDLVTSSSPGFPEYRDELAREGVPRLLHVFRFLRQRATTALCAGRLVVWNQPFTNEAVFRGLLRWVKESALGSHVIAVQMHVPPLLAFDRVKERERSGGHGMSHETFTSFVDSYYPFRDLGCQTIECSETTVSLNTARMLLRTLDER